MSSKAWQTQFQCSKASGYKGTNQYIKGQPKPREQHKKLKILQLRSIWTTRTG